jgi:hypothetical protein
MVKVVMKVMKGAQPHVSATDCKLRGHSAIAEGEARNPVAGFRVRAWRAPE